VVEKLTDLLYRIAPHNEWRTWMKIQVVGIDRLKLYREKKDLNKPDPPIVEPPKQESLEYPDDKFLLDWEDGAEGEEDPGMPYYLGGGGGGGQPPPPPPPPPGPQGGGGGVPAHAPVAGGAGQEGVAPGAPPQPVQGELDDVQQPVCSVRVRAGSALSLCISCVMQLDIINTKLTAPDGLRYNTYSAGPSMAL
jgi:hypothetical protein